MHSTRRGEPTGGCEKIYIMKIVKKKSLSLIISFTDIVFVLCAKTKEAHHLFDYADKPVYELLEE